MCIEKNIHFIYKSGLLPKQYQQYYDRVRQLHPEWQLLCHDDAAAMELVATHYPEWLEAYAAYPHQVQRTDIFRMMAVHHHGGFYMDLDIHCYKPLDSLIHHQLVLAEEKTMSAASCAIAGHEHPQRIANYMFGSQASHPFWKQALDAALGVAHQPIHIEEDVLETTGPGLLTNVYHQYKTDHSNAVTLLHNTSRLCTRGCGVSCQFGAYATHLHLGSWRWHDKAKTKKHI